MPLPQKIRFDGETATLTVTEFRSAPGDALDRVARGMEITVTKNGKPVAVLSPPETVVHRDGSFTGRAPLTYRQDIYDSSKPNQNRILRDRNHGDIFPRNELDAFALPAAHFSIWRGVCRRLHPMRNPGPCAQRHERQLPQPTWAEPRTSGDGSHQQPGKLRGTAMSRAEDHEWKCAGCGMATPGLHRKCDCITGCSYRIVGGKMETAIQIGPEADKIALSRLWQAIVDHTKGEGMFWIGEILLAELEKETGFKGQPAHPQHSTQQ